ncbi:MAG: hypothetical protein PHH85_01850 [Candidatus Methanoperedens sp.]|nr:hypothetical protein [Candidatus Methanoperedens sp.]
MKTEAEIRARIEELKEKMRSIKDQARSVSYGEPNYKNHLLRSGYMRDTMMCYGDIAVLLWVLNEPISQEIDLLTRLDPDDEINARTYHERRRKS